MLNYLNYMRFYKYNMKSFDDAVALCTKMAGIKYKYWCSVARSKERFSGKIVGNACWCFDASSLGVGVEFFQHEQGGFLAGG